MHFSFFVCFVLFLFCFFLFACLFVVVVVGFFFFFFFFEGRGGGGGMREREGVGANFSRLDAYQLFLPAWWVLFGDGCLKTRLGTESNKKIDNSTKILHYYINFCFRNCTCSIPYSISSDI